MPGPIVTLLTDFGGRDPSAAICRGVILGIAPDARLIDISHDVVKFAVRDGAHVLWCAVPHLPIAVHMAVVDPGVGTERRGIALRTARGDTLVGPDNGLLPPAADRLGGATAVHELRNSAYHLMQVSSSFHARDIFAPVAAHVAMGTRVEELGPAIPPDDLVRLDLPAPSVRPGELQTAVTYVDTFGNLKLAGVPADLEAALGPLRDGDGIVLARAAPSKVVTQFTVPWVATFGDVPRGAPLLYEDSYGRICLAVNQGDAGARFGLEVDEPISLRRA